MQAFRAAGSGTTQKSEVLEPTVHTWHPWHLLQGTRAVVVLPMVLMQETGKGESLVQALQGTRGPYPVRPSVQSSPASLRGTGASEPHQGAPTPPGRRTRTRPQRSHSPATMGRAVCEQSPSQGSHLPPQNSPDHSFPPSSSTQRNPQHQVPYMSALFSGSRWSLCPPTAITGRWGRKTCLNSGAGMVHRTPTHLLPASSLKVAKIMITRQPKLGSSLFLKPPKSGPKCHQFTLLFHMHIALLDHSITTLAAYPVIGLHHHLPSSLTAPQRAEPAG